MRLLSWLVRIVLFVVLLGFAMSNTEHAVLNFFGTDLQWRAPLVLFLLVFFAAGALIGVLSAVPPMLRQRREIARLRREVRDALAREPSAEPVTPPPLM